MKLSEAIEHALKKRVYDQFNPYMCNAMESLDHTYHVPAIEEMVESIAPDNYTLWGALNDTRPEFIGMSQADQFAFTSQLYCWWVFDLKRKGL